MLFSLLNFSITSVIYSHSSSFLYTLWLVTWLQWKLYIKQTSERERENKYKMLQKQT